MMFSVITYITCDVILIYLQKDTNSYATEVSPSQCMTISTASTILQDLLRTDNSTHQNLADMASWKSQGQLANKVLSVA